jgi:hypothetical protein
VVGTGDGWDWPIMHYHWAGDPQDMRDMQSWGCTVYMEPIRTDSPIHRQTTEGKKMIARLLSRPLSSSSKSSTSAWSDQNRKGTSGEQLCAATDSTHATTINSTSMCMDLLSGYVGRMSMTTCHTLAAHLMCAFLVATAPFSTAPLN